MKKLRNNQKGEDYIKRSTIRNTRGYSGLMNRIMSVMLLLIVAFGLSSATKENVTLRNNLSSNTQGEREAFDQLIGELGKDNRLEIIVTSVSVKQHGGIEHSFTGFGTGKVKKENDYVRTEPNGINTGFSDRRNFNGVKTVEHVYLSFSGNRFKIKVRLQTWGNKTIELANPTLEKRQQGYFATGNYQNGRRTFYYTIAMHESPSQRTNYLSPLGEIVTSG